MIAARTEGKTYMIEILALKMPLKLVRLHLNIKQWHKVPKSTLE